ncbi:hypothetical protein ABZ078_04315 [Streptomyces sp. NPDC006385]|uniref:hypothetical protein n=1 Tax=Streptomyces sp. NPDC006385 TaxID=3156761 RepID=UPI0033B49D7E
MSRNIVALRRKGVAAFVAATAALLVGAGAYSASAAQPEPTKVSANGYISYDAMRWGTIAGSNHQGQQANPYDRGCSKINLCRG